MRQRTWARQSGDPASALRLAEQVLEAAESEHVEALYLAAQLHARSGQREQAYLMLARAMGAGFLDRARLLEDQVFASYRGVVRRPDAEVTPPPATEHDWMAERAAARGLDLNDVL